MDWALTHLEGLKDICKHQVQINQPLPPEVLTDKTFTDALNDTDVNPIENTTAMVTNQPANNVFSPEFLANLEEISCLNECSGQGHCVNGKIGQYILSVLFYRGGDFVN